MSGSAEIRELYLDPTEVGVPWLLDPDSEAVPAAIRVARARTPGAGCDPLALAADIPDLLVLLRERHFGLATGVTDQAVRTGGLDAWAATWRQRLTTERPATWGTALGSDFYELRRMVGDRHLAAFGEDRDTVRSADPRAGERVRGEDSGPCVECRTVEGVLCVRLRSLDDSAGNERILNEWRDDHARHFAHDRMIVDVRGNAGGNDMYTHRWFADHVPAPVALAGSRTWELDGEVLNLWNAVVATECAQGPEAVPEWVRSKRLRPGPDATLAVVADRLTVEGGSSPWHGRMLVLTDRDTGSSAESSAWALRQVFGARLAGGRSTGCLTFGNIAPYLLPRSGMLVHLASKWNDHGDIEMVGFPVDVELDPGTPLHAVAADFDRLSPPATA